MYEPSEQEEAFRSISILIKRWVLHGPRCLIYICLVPWPFLHKKCGTNKYKKLCTRQDRYHPNLHYFYIILLYVGLLASSLFINVFMHLPKSKVLLDKFPRPNQDTFNSQRNLTYVSIKSYKIKWKMYTYTIFTILRRKKKILVFYS